MNKVCYFIFIEFNINIIVFILMCETYIKLELKNILDIKYYI